MSHLRRTLVYLGVLASATACADASYCPSQAGQVVELFSWWTQTGEVAARDALARAHQERMKHEGQPTRVLVTTMETNRLARDFLERNGRNRPMDKIRFPDTFQVNIGQELLFWQKDLEPVDFVLDEAPELRTGFFDGVLEEASSYDPNGNKALYGIPLNIHRMNTLFYNRETVDTLRQNGGHLDTLEGFERMCEALKAKYPDRAPIVLGTKGATWTLGLLVHQALYPAMWGVERYRKLWRGATTQQDDVYFEHLWQTYDRIRQWKDKGWINSDFAEVKWTDAANRLLLPAENQCQATFFIMGDWLQAEMASVEAARVGRAPFPSSEGNVEGNAPAFVWTADTFPLPKGIRNRENAVELLRTIARADVQLAFSRAKGAIPARGAELPWSEIEDELDAYSDFKQAREHHQAVLAVSGCLCDGELFAVDDKLETMLMDGNAEEIKGLWRTEYDDINRNQRTCFQSDP